MSGYMGDLGKIALRHEKVDTGSYKQAVKTPTKHDWRTNLS